MMKNLLATFFFLILFTYASAQSDQDDKSARNQDAPSHARQVITGDLTVYNSACVGTDCATNENYGFTTIMMKENNTRLRFFDTSNSGSFPSNDWEIEANETTNGGRNHLAVKDVDGNRLPFIIEAGARNNALVVGNNSGVGVGTDQPIGSAIHEKFGNTPTLRLEQDQSNGFTAQTWDLAGNEANFFVRDVTHASKLPFRIKPNAIDNAIFIDTDGVGIGTETPDEMLHIKRVDDAQLKIENTTTTNGGRVLLNLANFGPTRIQLENLNVTDGRWLNQVSNDGRYLLRNEADIAQEEFALDRDGNLVISGDLTANGNLIMSDRRLKSEVSQFDGGIDLVREMNPVTYRYNGKAGLSRDRSHIGLIAQELREIAPFLVHDHKYEIEDDNGRIVGAEDYLKIDVNALQFVLINALKDQDDIIKEQEVEIEELKGKVSELSRLEERIIALEAGLSEGKSGTIQDVILGDNSTGDLGQNRPNPYSDQTIIEYKIPERSNLAEIHFFSATGALLKKTVLSGKGKGEVRVMASELPAGVYQYSLIIDGKRIDTKQMQIQR